MRVWRLLAAAGIVGSVPLLVSAPAHAELTGPCSASGVIDGTTYDPKKGDEFEIPTEGDVEWQGSVPGGTGESRAIRGEVKVKLPGGIGDATIDTWNDDSDLYANSGTYHYELPSVLEGIEIPVTGFHEEPGVRCDGAVTVTVGDGGFSNPASIPALVLTALSAVLLVVSVRGGA